MAAGVSLLFMVVLIALGVVLRFAFARPILWINDILQLNSVAVVMLALPWATAQGAHVRVDVLDRAIGRRGRFAGDVLAHGLAAGLLAVLVWRAGLKAQDAMGYGDAPICYRCRSGRFMRLWQRALRCVWWFCWRS
jgi:TRAP-type C4-dicarboxylate transport system permease small subunit